MIFSVGPVGHLIKGDVLDCRKESIEKALQAHDAFLYVKWNPKKMRGHGCWEIRRRPEFNSTLDICDYEDVVIHQVGEYEQNLVHHVLDCAFLNYDQIRKIKEMDVGHYRDPERWQAEMEYKKQMALEAATQQTKIAVRDAAKTFKNEIRAFKDFVLNGGNPHLIAAYWEHVKALE